MIQPVPTKKSVALSGVVAGNTSICTVGQHGNDLHYRGFDISDLAEHATFEEVAWILIRGHLPTAAELEEYRARLRQFQALPAAVKRSLELIQASAHPMDVLRTGGAMLGTIFPERGGKDAAHDVADRLIASFGSMLCYWYHFSHHGRRIDTESGHESVAGHFLGMCIGPTRGPT